MAQDASARDVEAEAPGLLSVATMETLLKPERLQGQHWAIGSKVCVLGQRGVIDGVDATTTGNYRVQLQDAGERLSMTPEDFVKCEREEHCRVEGCAVEDASPSAPEAEALKAAQALFTPGSVFRGTIAIPGMPGETDEVERMPYCFDVVSDFSDELGNAVLVRHAAYGDEQSCHLKLQMKSSSSSAAPQVAVSWRDDATICNGIVELTPDSCMVRGKVSQLVAGEAGFYEPGKETHTFELRRETTCKAEQEHNLRIEAATRLRAETLYTWLHWNPVDSWTRPDAFTSITQLPWKEITLVDTCRLCEDLCALLRRRSFYLDDLHFETPESKETELKNLCSAGNSRAATHAQIDNHHSVLKTLMTARAELHSTQADQSCRMTTTDFYELQMACLKCDQRMQESYAQFDSSLRAAEARFPRSILDSWKRRDVAVDASCVVCFLDFSDSKEEEPVQLPCGHWFHFDCASHWLHCNRTCPYCRSDLKSESEEAGGDIREWSI